MNFPAPVLVKNPAPEFPIFWLAGPFKCNFDLTIIKHVESLDYMQYFWGYDSKAFNEIVKKRAEAGRGKA